MMNELIREAHKMADKALLKAKLDSARKDAVEWLQGEADGFKRWHILAFAIAPFAVAFLVA
jgi:hypothetical protein